MVSEHSNPWRKSWAIGLENQILCKIPDPLPALAAHRPYSSSASARRPWPSRSIASSYGSGVNREARPVQPSSLSGYGGGPNRCLAKVPDIVPGKIPKPASISGKITKSMVRYEEEASDPTAVWRIATVANHKADMVQQRRSDFQKVVTGLQESMNRVEALLQRLANPQARVVEPRNLQDWAQSGKLETAVTRRIEDMRQSNLESIQGIQLMRTSEGNLKFPPTGPSVVVTGWDLDPLPHAFTASPTLNNMNPSHGPEMAKDIEKGVEFTVKEGLDCAVLEDFGIPSWLFGLSLPNPDLNQRLGTPDYMTPEQWQPNIRVPKLDFPKFDGGESFEWNQQSETNFAVVNDPDEAKSNLVQLYKVGRADRRLKSLGLLWNLPPWPDLNFCEVNWMANGMEKDVYNAVTWQSKIYSQQAKSKPFIEAGVKSETPSTDLIASGNNTPQRCFSPTKSGTGTFEYQNNSPGVATPPPEFCCQISMKLMSEPVIIASGQTYEREKLSQFCHVPVANIFSLYDVSNIGHIPLLLWDQKAYVAILKDPSLKSIAWEPNLEEWVARAILYGTLQGTDVLNSTDKIKEDPKSNIDIALYNFHQEYEVLELRNFHRKSRTGLEENKDFPIVWNSVIAGRYRVTKYLGSATFSKVVQEHLFIVTELLRVNLYEFQKESGDELYFSLPRIQAVAQQCLEALVYLHHLNIVHCDLTPENILMKSYSRCEIKVIDLGNSCFLTENLSLYVQSCSYRTPEVILDLPYDQKIDIWSLGCILAELYIGFPVQWYDGPVYSNRHQRSTVSSTSYGSNSSPVENQSQRPTTNLRGMHVQILPSGMGLTSPSYTTRMYPDSRFYGQYGPHGNTLTARLGYGSNVYNSRNNGHWGVVDTKYKPRGRAPFVFGSENQDGFIELNRKPRSGGFKHQKPFGPTVTIAMKGQAIHTIGKQENSVLPDNRQFNQEGFPVTYKDAKFFIIKSYREDDVHKCVKYNVWASTPNGNKKLNAGYREAQEKLSECPVFLFFFVNTSVQFVGVAEMVGPVDFDKTVDYWQQDKWNGCFPVKWHIVKDVPNNILKHITLDNYDNKPVTHYRDTREVKLEQCLEMLKIFKDHVSKTSTMAGLFNSGRTAAAKKLFKSLKVLYKIQLPEGVGIHPGFHDSLLKIHCSPKANSSSDLSLVSKDSKLKAEPISVLENSVVTQWLIPWKNLLSDDASWNDADFINGAFPGFYSHTINS